MSVDKITAKITAVLPLVKKIFDFSHKKRKKALENAWKTIPVSKRYEIVKDYYANIYESMFSFELKEGGTKVMPFLVLPEWSQIESVCTDNFKDKHEHIELSNEQMGFLQFFGEMQGPDSKWLEKDDDVFWPVSFEVKGLNLVLSFQLCKFSEAFVCQYLLEHELLACQIPFLFKDIFKKHHAIRDKVASDLSSIFTFFEKHPARMGINNLLLLRKDEEHYVAMVGRRAKSSMVHQPLLDTASSCIWSIQTFPDRDREPWHTVTREIAEELFGYPEARSKFTNPDHHYQIDGISDLKVLKENGEAEFHVTGFGIDLVRLVPEITTMTIVRDSSYYEVHNDPTSGKAQIKYNDELFPVSELEIPAGLVDADIFLREEVITNPFEGITNKGFDPELWTLPASFSFVQGIKKASRIGI